MFRITTCPYCKDSVSEPEAVYCPACDAIHHPDCWESNGRRCSVYGCESTSDEPLLGCPWCQEAYSDGRKNCMICNSPLMTPDECIAFVDRHEWMELRLSDETNASLTAGYLRNNGVITRISKRAPISMFRIGQRASLWVVKEQEQMASRLLQELLQRYTYCSECSHVLFQDEQECSYCDESKSEE